MKERRKEKKNDKQQPIRGTRGPRRGPFFPLFFCFHLVFQSRRCPPLPALYPSPELFLFVILFHFSFQSPEVPRSIVARIGGACVCLYLVIEGWVTRQGQAPNGGGTFGQGRAAMKERKSVEGRAIIDETNIHRRDEHPLTRRASIEEPPTIDKTSNYRRDKRLSTTKAIIDDTNIQYRDKRISTRQAIIVVDDPASRGQAS